MAITPPPEITPPPAAPIRGDRATFSGRVDAFVTWLIYAVTQFAGLAASAYANAVSAASSAAAAIAAAASAIPGGEAAKELLNRYYGHRAVAPTTRPDGTPMQPGDRYFDTVEDAEKTFNGSIWYVPNIDSADLAAEDGSAGVGFKQAGDGATARDSQAKMRERVSVDDFFLAGESDWTGAARRAIRYCENNKKKLHLDQVYAISDELFIRKRLKIQGIGSGSGYGEEALTGYDQISGFLVRGTGPRRIRTRQRWRGSASDPQDAPLSCAINVQAENCMFEDFTVFLDFDRADFSPRNYGFDWDCGFFFGTRVHNILQNVHVMGYWREAAIWCDVTRQTGLPQFSDPDGNPFEPGTVQNGGDGFTMYNCFTRGGKWGVRVAGSQPKAGENIFTDPYYDQILGAAVQDRRGSFGFSDFTMMACSIYGTDHHSNWRRDDPTGNYLTDTAGGAMWISGMNGAGRIQGMRFMSTRFATFEPYRIRLGRCNRVQFYGCHFESRSGSLRRTSTGEAIAFDSTDTYGTISMEANTSNCLVFGHQGALLARGAEAFIDPAATYHELFSGSSAEISTTTHTIVADGFRAKYGELDLRSLSAEHGVRLRAGSNTLAAFSGNGQVFGASVAARIQATTGELDLWAAAETALRMRIGNATTVLIDQVNATFTVSGAIRPTTDNVVKAGDAAHRYSQLFSGNNTINTSDAREKLQRGGLSEAELRAWSQVRPVVFQWIESITRKDAATARLNVGYIAQDVQEAFEAEGLSASDYALWCSDAMMEVRTKHRAVMRPKLQTVEFVEEYIDVVNGTAILKARPATKEVAITKTVGVVDEAGNPVMDGEGNQVMHTYAEMEEVQEAYEVEEPTGEVRLGLRYEQCLVFECAYLRSMISPA